MLPRHQVAVVTSHALSLITDHLCDDSSDMSGVDLAPCKCQLELSSMSEVMSLLRCFLCSKTAVCQLSNVEVDKLASLLLQVIMHASCNMLLHTAHLKMYVQWHTYTIDNTPLDH